MKTCWAIQRVNRPKGKQLLLPRESVILGVPDQVSGTQDGDVVEGEKGERRW